jgi:hypothetical protein
VPKEQLGQQDTTLIIRQPSFPGAHLTIVSLVDLGGLGYRAEGPAIAKLAAADRSPTPSAPSKLGPKTPPSARAMVCPSTTTATCSPQLAALDRQTITFAGQKIEKLTTPTPVQYRAFQLLGAAVPLAIS